MRLSRTELFFMNQITKGPLPFGVSLKYDRSCSVEDQKKQIVTSFQQKRLMDEKEQLTKEGFALLQIWESYRRCDVHLIINKNYIAVYPDRRSIILSPVGEEYELYSVDSSKILFTLIKECSFMQGEDYTPDKHVYIMDYDKWYQEIAEYDSNIMVIGEFYKRATKSEMVYYWNNQKGYQYDFHSKEKRELSPRMLRIQCMRYLNVKEIKNG